MNQLNFYKISVIILLVLNLALAFFLIQPKRGNMPPQPRPPHERGRMGATELMDLSEEQHRLFLENAKEHTAKMDEINLKQHELLKVYFSKLTDEKIQVNRDSIRQEVQELEGEKIKFTYQHFDDIKSILEEDQQEGYEDFTNKMLARVLRLDNRRQRPPRRGKEKRRE